MSLRSWVRSQHCILNGHHFTLIRCKNCIDICLKKTENKSEAGDGPCKFFFDKFNTKSRSEHLTLLIKAFRFRQSAADRSKVEHRRYLFNFFKSSPKTNRGIGEETKLHSHDTNRVVKHSLSQTLDVRE